MGAVVAMSAHIYGGSSSSSHECAHGAAALLDDY